jgi:hypothetical protein
MPTVMLALFREVRDAFTGYATMLQARVPAPAPHGPSSLPGDSYDVPADPVAGGPPLVERLSLIIATADYAAETLPALAETVRKVADPSARDSIELDGVADTFLTLQAGALKSLAGVEACLLDRPLRALIATQWERLTEVGDSSPYVADVARILRATVPLARAKLNEAAFRNFCDKFAKAFIGRYQAAIFKCARIGEVGAQQLLLDAQGMRSLLLAAPTMRGPADRAGTLGGGGGGGGEEEEDIRAAITGGGEWLCVGVWLWACALLWPVCVVVAVCGCVRVCWRVPCGGVRAVTAAGRRRTCAAVAACCCGCS